MPANPSSPTPLRTRFAPSPTGPLHLGHGYAALMVSDFAAQTGAQILLRIEDTDTTRCRPEFETTMIADLTWLGFTWDACNRQSDRMDGYAEALDRLKVMGLAYPCFCSRTDIAAAVSASGAELGPDGPLYPGTCRSLSPDQAWARAQDEPHAVRLNSRAAFDRIGPLHWDEQDGGQITVQPDIVGDVMLKGKDRDASYHLAVVVDDARDGVSHVVRGADLFSATHAHRLLQSLLTLPVPAYHHHGLLTDSSGRKLAKSDGDAGLSARREAGENGHALATALRAHRFPAGILFKAP